MNEKFGPEVGDIVHYQSFGSPGGEYKSEPRASIVTVKPDSDGRIGICVLNPEGMFFKQGVPADFGDTPVGGTWHWPRLV